MNRQALTEVPVWSRKRTKQACVSVGNSATVVLIKIAWLLPSTEVGFVDENRPTKFETIGVKGD